MEISLLIIFISITLFKNFLEYINLKHLKKYGKNIPAEFKGYIDEVTLKKVIDYTIEHSYFTIIESIFNTMLIIVFLFGGLLNLYNSWIASFKFHFILSGLLFFILIIYMSSILSIPFDLYMTFKIENKYGFNTSTPRLWLTDFIKSIIISTVIISIIVSVGLWLVQISPQYWWIWVWIFFFIFSIFMMYVSPYVIEPLFNKFTPIDDKGLEKKIKELMQKVNIKVSRVFKIDASKRSRHTNAYFSGIGKVKRIVLYDTLLEKMNQNEILAVLAHEAGHWKKKHILKQIIILEGLSLIGIYIAFRIIQSDLLIDLFQIEKETFFAKVFITIFLGSIVYFPFTPLNNYILRRFEKEADRFACYLTKGTKHLINSLIKLSKDNLSNLHPHPLYAAFYYSHPPVVKRIREIKKLFSG